MYYLWRYHNVGPGEFAKMEEGEQQVLFAFMLYEVEERNRAAAAGA